MAVRVNYFKKTDGVIREVLQDQEWDWAEVFVGARIANVRFSLAEYGGNKDRIAVMIYHLSHYYNMGLEQGQRDKMREIKRALQIP